MVPFHVWFHPHSTIAVRIEGVLGTLSYRGLAYFEYPALLRIEPHVGIHPTSRAVFANPCNITGRKTRLTQ